jgi:hypothetical protein
MGMMRAMIISQMCWGIGIVAGGAVRTVVMLELGIGAGAAAAGVAGVVVVEGCGTAEEGTVLEVES